MDIEVLENLVKLAESGMKICLKRLPEEAGYLKHPGFTGLRNRLEELSSKNWEDAAPGKPLVEGDHVPWFHARTKGGQLYLFFAHPLARDFKYPVKYGQADTQETIKRSLRVNWQGQSIPVELVFRPYESLLLKISKSGKVEFITLPEFRALN